MYLYHNTLFIQPVAHPSHAQAKVLWARTASAGARAQAILRPSGVMEAEAAAAAVVVAAVEVEAVVAAVAAAVVVVREMEVSVLLLQLEFILYA